MPPPKRKKERKKEDRCEFRCSSRFATLIHNPVICLERGKKDRIVTMTNETFTRSALTQVFRNVNQVIMATVKPST
jgi:hypothetical protein